MQTNEDKKLVVVQLSASRLQEMMEQAATLGAMAALKSAGVGTCEWKTRAEMIRLYGRHSFDNALKNGLKSKLFGRRAKYSTIEFNNLVIR